MMDRAEAEEHLRVIRSLMEKATLYRAISAPTAVLGGTLSLLVGLFLAFPFSASAETPSWFFGPWLCVLAITGGANTYFIHREAERRGDPFLSPGMKMALTALAPSHLVAAFITVLALVGTGGIHTSRIYLALPALWCVAYGLGLLATHHFAPRSLTCLGWCFLVAGLTLGTTFFFGFGAILPAGLHLAQISNLAMAATFGFFHLIYGLCAWPRAAKAGQGVLA
jgi:hypothetical protein